MVMRGEQNYYINYKFNNLANPRLYTGGTFDVPHVGHLNFFKLCKQYFPTGHLTVALNEDDFIKEFKGKPPLFSYQERLKLLSVIDYIDEIVPNFSGADSKPSILRAEPNIIIIGNDWLEKDYCKQMGFDAQWLRERKIALVYLPYTEGISTTEIKKRMNNA